MDSATPIDAVGEMEAHFDRLAQHMHALCGSTAVWTLALQAEASDFVRFNHAAIRQPGHVVQIETTVRVVDGRRHASRAVALSGVYDEDALRLSNAVAELRALLPSLPEDPYLALNTQAQTTRRVERSAALDARAMVEDIVTAARGDDLVGILSSGSITSGFASSNGVQHWHEIDCYDFDFSLHREGGEAVKTSRAGRAWDRDGYLTTLERARHDLERLSRPARRIAPGRYRAYFAPTATAWLLGIMNWGGFSAKEQRTKRSSLTRLANGEAHFHPQVNLTDDLTTGHAPAFDQQGFVRTTPLPLVVNGRFAHAVTNARTGAEYGITHTGADAEQSVALTLGAGDLPLNDAVHVLGDGLYINNLWYLNYSDRVNARVTGMTRFATFWVEGGVVVGPCEPMRFDDSLFSLFGDGLEALTRERELIVDGSSYTFRSTKTSLAPGLLVKGFNLTL